jgi:hypothetical protein
MVVEKVLSEEAETQFEQQGKFIDRRFILLANVSKMVN